MKKLFIFILGTILTSISLHAQAPEKISYQAVIRDGNNDLITSQQIGMQISILQGSITSSSVYVETQTPTTNDNGLASIEIGGGNVQSGDFSAIDWSTGVYFIKTEVDPTGGASYTIIGTSQLVSVPFALHAKTADSLIGRVGVSKIDTTNWNNKQDQLSAGTGIDITSNVISTTSTSTTYSVGDLAQGGIVFWVDETGQHGLVCAKEDQSAGVRWYAGTKGDTQAKGDGLFAGKGNTSIIIAAQVAIGDDGSTYAARICNELEVVDGDKTYGDWYLPSKEELHLMHQNIEAINSTANANGGSELTGDTYWSSTEGGSGSAWAEALLDGEQANGPKTYEANVRAVRAF